MNLKMFPVNSKMKSVSLSKEKDILDQEFGSFRKAQPN